MRMKTDAHFTTKLKRHFILNKEKHVKLNRESTRCTQLEKQNIAGGSAFNIAWIGYITFFDVVRTILFILFTQIVSQ